MTVSPVCTAPQQRVIPDRVEAGTFLIAGAMTSGQVFVRGARAEHLDAFVQKLRATGIGLEIETDGIAVTGRRTAESG